MNFIIGLISIIIVNILLSGDNAVVIALASRKLPDHERRKAIFWGTTIAVVLRIFLTIMVAWLLKIPFLRLIGGLLLVWIAVKLASPNEDIQSTKQVEGLWNAIKTIIIADLAMSTDNVLAVAGAANGNIVLLVFGLIISIPIIIAGSSLIGLLLKRFPFVIWIGVAILGWTAGQLIGEDEFAARLLDFPNKDLIVPLFFTVLVIVVARWQIHLSTRHQRSMF